MNHLKEKFIQKFIVSLYQSQKLLTIIYIEHCHNIDVNLPLEQRLMQIFFHPNTFTLASFSSNNLTKTQWVELLRLVSVHLG